tara:strand:- start:239 stop:865 length:627 start_codon:yes stop_codon:yes gene_type:complete
MPELPMYPNAPEHIDKLAQEVRRLDQETKAAYESGNHQRAEELDALYADKLEQLESAMDEMGHEGESKTGGEERYETRGLEQMGRQLAVLYWHYVNEMPYQATVLTKEELLEMLRAIAGSYGYLHGGFKKETTDEQLLDAAKDAYDRKASFLKRYELTTANEKKEKTEELTNLIKVHEKGESKLNWLRILDRMPLSKIDQLLDFYREK